MFLKCLTVLVPTFLKCFCCFFRFLVLFSGGLGGFLVVFLLFWWLQPLQERFSDGLSGAGVVGVSEVLGVFFTTFLKFFVCF